MMTGLFLIAWIDARKRMIPNKWLLLLTGIKVMFLVAEYVLGKENWQSICSDSIKGFIIGGGILFFCYWLTAGRIGAGDVKLFAVLGFYLGAEEIYYAMFFSILSAAIYCMNKMLHKNLERNWEIPFAPFILLGTVMAILWERIPF